MALQNINIQLPAAVSSLINESALTGYGKLATGDDFLLATKKSKRNCQV